MELKQQEASASEVTKVKYPKIVNYLQQIYDYNPKDNFKP